MNRPLAAYARKILSRSEGPVLVEGPVFLWELGAHSPNPSSDDAIPTLSEGGESAPRPGAPLVIELPPPRAHHGELSLGRSEGCDVVVAHPSVSRLHAVLHYESRAQKWRVTDAGSHNGTALAGRVLSGFESGELQDGGSLRVGEVELVFYLPESFLKEVERRLGEEED